MCNLTMKKTDLIRYGTKVVAIHKKSGERYSVAMGFCYDRYETIPNVTKQKGISGYFYNGILNDMDGCYSSNMIGRTSLFEYLSDARALYKAVEKYFNPDIDPELSSKWRLAIMSCSVEEDIMSGDYGGKRVIAGRKLTFLREATGD